jgi:hypothetical protein
MQADITWTPHHINGTQPVNAVAACYWYRASLPGIHSGPLHSMSHTTHKTVQALKSVLINSASYHTWNDSQEPAHMHTTVLSQKPPPGHDKQTNKQPTRHSMHASITLTTRQHII